MSTKRTAAEAEDDEERDEVFQKEKPQNEDNAKRAKLTPALNGKTLQDLPIRLLERILVKTVVTEVRSMRLVKLVWKEKADLVISRLKAVCSLWSMILSTYAFLTEVHRILDGTAQKTIRLDIEHHSCFPYSVYKFTTLKEEIFLLSRTDGQTTADVRVYKRNKLAKAIAIIALPSGSRPLNVEACSVSNCVYVLCANEKSNEFHQSVLRIRKAGKHRYNISPWVSDLSLTYASISVLPNGILSVTNGWDPVALRNYDANGSLVLSTDIYGLGFVDRVLEKANGNLVLGSVLRNDMNRRVLTEIAKDGRMRWQHVSSIDVCMLNRVHFADAYDRILIADYMGGSELLDSELNLLESEELRPRVDIIQLTNYDSERNEVVGVCFGNPDFEDCRPVFCTFRFTEE